MTEKPYYTFPNQIVNHQKIEDVENELLNELIMLGRKLSVDELKKIIIQVRAVIDLDQ